MARCEKCGKEKDIGFNSLEDEVHKRIEAIAGKCRCGGKFTMKERVIGL